MRYAPKYPYVKDYKTDGVLSTFLYTNLNDEKSVTVIHRDNFPVYLSNTCYRKGLKDTILRDFIEKRLYEGLK